MVCVAGFLPESERQSVYVLVDVLYHRTRVLLEIEGRSSSLQFLAAYHRNLQSVSCRFSVVTRTGGKALHVGAMSLVTNQRSGKLLICHKCRCHNHCKSVTASKKNRTEKRIKVAPSKASLPIILPFAPIPSQIFVKNKQPQTPSQLPMPDSLHIVQSTHRVRCAA